MCAITGIVQSSQNVTLSSLEALSASLQHRGPDGNGYFIDEKVGFYHKRLAIHDLSESGKQPFSSRQGIQAVVNGEIYNYLALKESLPDIHWQSNSDCEVIPYLYEHHGHKFFEQLRGMYAIAIYDPRDQSVILSRDPFGMKQIYYYQDDLGFYFASEIGALTKFLNLTDTNLAVTQEIAQLHFDTGVDTAIKGVKRVLPGETLVIRDTKIQETYYYPSKLGFPKPTPIIKDNYLKQFEAVFEETVDLHLKADVPVGLFLSGGIDSTCLLAMVSRLINQPIHTYTIGFPNTNTHDERSVAAALAKHFQTNHTEIAFTEQDFWELLPKAIAATDDPTADYAIVPTFKLAQAASKDVTVVLSGEGGDEVFAGYGRYRQFIKPWWQKRRDLYRKGDLTRLGLLKNDKHTWQTQIQQIKKDCLDNGYDRLYTAQTIDMQTWLPNDLLIKLDRCLMRHSLEGRTPFLDKSMIAFANSLPNSQKINGKMGKWILRNWLHQNVTGYDAFAHKKGFTVPIQTWLENKRDWLQDYLPQQPLIRELCHTPKLEKILAKPLTKTSARAAWSLLYLAFWDD